jgi:hypothetical protein
LAKLAGCLDLSGQLIDPRDKPPLLGQRRQGYLDAKEPFMLKANSVCSAFARLFACVNELGRPKVRIEESRLYGSPIYVKCPEVIGYDCAVEIGRNKTDRPVSSIDPREKNLSSADSPLASGSDFRPHLLTSKDDSFMEEPDRHLLVGFLRLDKNRFLNLPEN